MIGYEMGPSLVGGLHYGQDFSGGTSSMNEKMTWLLTWQHSLQGIG